MAELERNATPKPLRGEYDRERKLKQRQHKAREAETMRWVKNVRDSGKCRVPRCRFTDLTVECCHDKHRGMGGNKAEDRTVTALLFAGCKTHHAMFDRQDLVAEPLTPAGFDGPAAWYLRDRETGRLDCIGVESRIGVSETRGV